MTFCFEEDLNIIFRYYDLPPTQKGKCTISPKTLLLYGMYRNALHDTRIHNKIDDDILAFQGKFDASKLNCASEPLYQYASYVSIDAMNEWYKKKNTKCYLAFKKSGIGTKLIGFVNFYEETHEDRNIVYVSHVTTEFRGQGIGKRLMQAALAHFEPGTEFMLHVRKTNVSAVALYKERLGFEVCQLPPAKAGDLL